MKILHLTLKKKWFDMILSGKKDEEYRELKEYWATRLEGRNYDVVKFRNGYMKDSPKMTVEYKGFRRGFGSVNHGAPESNHVYIIMLGKVLDCQT